MVEDLKGITLYIRKKPSWINYLNNIKEFDDFLDSITVEKPIVIGDVAMFNTQMKNRLLKVLEEYKHISLYASSDVGDDVLLSRISNVEKEAPIFVRNGIEKEKYEDSPRDYQSVASNLSSLPYNLQLRCKGLTNRIINLVITQLPQNGSDY